MRYGCHRLQLTVSPGKGSILKISNGESLDSSDLSEILNLYKPKKTLLRSYKDNLSWGYE